MKSMWMTSSLVAFALVATVGVARAQQPQGSDEPQADEKTQDANKDDNEAKNKASDKDQKAQDKQGADAKSRTGGQPPSEPSDSPQAPATEPLPPPGSPPPPPAAGPTPGVAPGTPPPAWHMGASPGAAQPGAHPPPSRPAVDRGRQPQKPRHPHPLAFWQVAIGSRTIWMTDEHLDPFAEEDGNSLFEMMASRTLLLSGPWSVAAGLGFSKLSLSTTARSADTELTAKRLALIGEGRYHFSSALYGLVRLSPQLQWTKATMDDASALNELEANSWQLGADVSAGVAWNPLETFKIGSGNFGLWAMAEGGYSLVGNSSLELKTTGDDEDPQETSTLDMGDVNLGGPMVRIMVGLSY